MGFTATKRYPGSRIGSTTTSTCERCKSGEMRDSRLRLLDTDDNVLEMLKWTCSACGYTMIFDLEVALSQSFEAPDYTEEFPEWVEQLRKERRA